MGPKPITRVVNIRTSSLWIKARLEQKVFIGRPSKWGNPFMLDRDGTRDEVITKHMEYLRKNPKLMMSLKDGELVGKLLGCFCKPGRCHGDNYIIVMKEMGVI